MMQQYAAMMKNRAHLKSTGKKNYNFITQKENLLTFAGRVSADVGFSWSWMGVDWPWVLLHSTEKSFRLTHVLHLM